MRKPSCRESGRQGTGVRDDVGRVLAEGRLARLPERNRLGRDDVHERAALQAGEHGLVDARRVLSTRQDRAGSRSAQRLVGRERDDVGVWHRRRVRAAGNQTRDVRSVDEQHRADLVGDRPERHEVDRARICRRARDDQPRTLAHGQVADHVVVEHLGVVVDAVRDEVVHTTAEVDRRSVGEVTALIQAHPHHLVARLQQGHEGGLVRVGTGVRLHVCVLGAEELTRTRAGQTLGFVDHEVAAVVTLSRVTLRVLVREHRALRFDHCT